ncbi:MAG: N-acetylglucosamine-6-phosphate deacetylase [Propionibacteriaceae bacterium]|nr:N-acetylglucosamine-6-phosphate deacetylase [Propionibacteriaceae bacterium]
MTLIYAERLYGPQGLVDGGWVKVSGERIEAWGRGSSWGSVSASPHPDVVVDGILSPGFVDVHCHGGGGANFGADPVQAETVRATHAAHGTTSIVASLVTGSLADLEEQVRVLSRLVADGRLAGIHLEGPWLAPEYKGAHAEHLLIDPLPADIERLVQAGNGAIRLVTIAPERPGALDAIRLLTQQGVVVALGHTAADFDATRLAIEAGARGATHLFNAMPDILHRSPGPALALWQDPKVWVELICDGVHVHPALAAQVMATKPDTSVLITDAMAAAAYPDGHYTLGDQDVEVRDQVARLSGTATIAGSTLTLDKAVRTAVQSGIPLSTALKAATSNPADYLGLPDVGRIAPGMWANLVCLTNTLTVTAVMRHGQWITT